MFVTKEVHDSVFTFTKKLLKRYPRTILLSFALLAAYNINNTLMYIERDSIVHMEIQGKHMPFSMSSDPDTINWYRCYGDQYQFVIQSYLPTNVNNQINCAIIDSRSQPIKIIARRIFFTDELEILVVTIGEDTIYSTFLESLES